MNKLIAVVGMSGTGKSVVTDYLESNKWTKLYFGGITYKLMAEEGIERTADGKSEKEFREKLRKEHGPECYAKFLDPEIKDNGILKALKKSRILRQIDGTLCYDYKLIPVALLNNGILRTYDYSGVLEHMEKITNKED